MSSVLRHAAQPLTPTFVTSSSGSPKMFSLAQINTAVATATGFTNVGSLYTTNTNAHFVTFITTLQASGTALANSETLRDLGAEVTLGTAGGENNLTLRLVQRTTGTVADGSMSAPTGYVVVRNYVSKDNSTADGNLTAQLPVCVSRQ